MKNRRDLLKRIIQKICKKIVVIIKHLPFPIEDYTRPSIRKLCSKLDKKCSLNPHCIYKNGKCSLILLERSPIDGKALFPFYVDKITDEILYNRLLRDEIMEDKIDEILNETVNVRNDEILIDGAKGVFEQIRYLYEPKKEFTFRTNHQLDDMKLMPLPSYWKGHMPRFNYYDDCSNTNSLYSSLLYILAIISPEIRSVIQLKNTQIDKIENITITDINKEPMFANIGTDINDAVNRIIEIYKHFNHNTYKNINTITQLKEFIFTDDYPANAVDIFLLSNALAINIIILEKRLKKSNPNGYYAFINSLKRDTIVLMENPIQNKYCYNIVGKNKNYIFKMRDMPNIIKKNYGIANIMVNENNIKVNNSIIKKKIKLRSKFIKK